MEKHVEISFCFLIGKNATEPFKTTNDAYGEKTMSRVQAYKYFLRFQKGRTSLEDNTN